MDVYIKNMVCDRCVRVVREELEQLGLRVERVELGLATVAADSATADLVAIKRVLKKNGFEYLEDRKAQLVEQVKTLIIELISSDLLEHMDVNLSEYLAEQLGKNYNYLSGLFSSITSMTIERYLILQKIERVKELLAYDELSLSEIAYRLGYSSVQHLSTQFKTVTGLSPSHFKDLRSGKRKSLDHLT
jgi:AraC-like DNA-binding protein